MLDAKHRPDVSTIYVMQVDVVTLEEQVKDINKKLKKDVENGRITITTTEPTQSQLASVVFTSTNLVLRDGDIVRLLSHIRDSFVDPIRFDVGAGKLAASIEMSRPSSMLAQKAYTVADLPT